MPLVNCPDCNKTISSSARYCLHCGRRPNKSIFIQDIGFDGVLFRLMIAVGIILIPMFGFSLLGVAIGGCLILSGILFLLLR